MTTQELLDQFNALLLKNSWWSRFVNSQFIKMFSVMGSQVIYVSKTAAEKALTEGFISTATRRSSILAAAEDKGYVARLITPAEGTALVKNKTDNDVAIPIYTTLLSDEQNAYMIMEPLILRRGEEKSDVKIKQLEKKQITVDVDSEVEFRSVTLEKELTARCSSIDVYVTENGAKKSWAYNPQFRLSKKNSRDYVMFYRPTEQIGIRFGDGSIGKMPAAGERIIIDVWLSDGDITLVQGQSLTPTGQSSDLANVIEIKADTPITNGAGYETTEETRNRAQYYVAFDEQVVWGADYKHYLRSVIPNISWISAWGEKEQEESTGIKSLTNINTVFLCGHKKGLSQADMEKTVIAALKGVPNELNKRFRYVPTKERPFTIKLSGVALKTLNIVDAERRIRAALEERAGRDSTSFDRDDRRGIARVANNDIWAIIEETGVLTQFELTVSDMREAVALNDFIYLDVERSTFLLTY